MNHRKQAVKNHHAKKFQDSNNNTIRINKKIVKSSNSRTNKGKSNIKAEQIKICKVFLKNLIESHKLYAFAYRENINTITKNSSEIIFLNSIIYLFVVKYCIQFYVTGNMIKNIPKLYYNYGNIYHKKIDEG